MTQWFHVYEMHDGIVELVFNTFAKVFPHLEIWDPGTGDLILLGSQKPWRTGVEVWQAVFDRPEPRKDLATIGLLSPQMIWARQLASQRTARWFIENGPEQSDEFPVLEYEAPRAFFVGGLAKGFLQFDERIRQFQLAPMPKRVALHTATAEQLAPVFPQYGSVNPEVAQAAGNRVFSLTNRFATLPPVNIFMPPLAREDYQALVINVEQWLRAGGTNQTSLTMNDVGDAIRECLAHGELERARALLGLAGGRLKNGAELRFLERVWQREAAATKP